MKRVRQKSINFLFETGTWDDFFSGYCEYKNHHYYFIDAVNFGNAKEENYKFLMFPISDEVFSYNHFMHEMFRRHIGCHMDFIDGNIWKKQKIFLPSQMHSYYFDLHNKTILGEISCKSIPVLCDDVPMWYFFLYEED